MADEMTTNQKVQTTIEDLKSKSISELITLWNLTETQELTAEVATVRGWLMDAFEYKNPEAFNNWMENVVEDDKVETYFSNN